MVIVVVWHLAKIKKKMKINLHFIRTCSLSSQGYETKNKRKIRILKWVILVFVTVGEFVVVAYGLKIKIAI